MHVFHPLFLFNQFGDLKRCALRPGNVHSADGWENLPKSTNSESVSIGMTGIRRMSERYAAVGVRLGSEDCARTIRYR